MVEENLLKLYRFSAEIFFTFIFFMKQNKIMKSSTNTHRITKNQTEHDLTQNRKLTLDI